LRWIRGLLVHGPHSCVIARGTVFPGTTVIFRGQHSIVVTQKVSDVTFRLDKDKVVYEPSADSAV
ncbi:MAG: hypothetical protein PHQ23_17050, partial [Candidatus Wallbacteria bacterium]|nr:hypothetical protein [Candidatus Wallbacteria bacterium]